MYMSLSVLNICTFLYIFCLPMPLGFVDFTHRIFFFSILALQFYETKKEHIVIQHGNRLARLDQYIFFYERYCNLAGKYRLARLDQIQHSSFLFFVHCTIITTVIKLWQFNTVYVHYGNLFSNGLYNIHYVHGINSTYGTHSQYRRYF